MKEKIAKVTPPCLGYFSKQADACKQCQITSECRTHLFQHILPAVAQLQHIADAQGVCSISEVSLLGGV